MKISNFTKAQKEALINVIRFTLEGNTWGYVKGRKANVLRNTGMCIYKADHNYSHRNDYDFVVGVDYNKLMLHPQGFAIMQEAKEKAQVTVWENLGGLQRAYVKFEVGDKVDFIGYYGTSNDDMKWYCLEGRTMDEPLTIAEVVLNDKYDNFVHVVLSNGFRMNQFGYVPGLRVKGNCLAKR